MWKTKISSSGLKSISCPGLSSRLHLKFYEIFRLNKFENILNLIESKAMKRLNSKKSKSTRFGHSNLGLQHLPADNKMLKLWPSGPQKRKEKHPKKQLEVGSSRKMLIFWFGPSFLAQSEVEKCWIMLNYSKSFNPPHSAIQVFFPWPNRSLI